MASQPAASDLTPAVEPQVLIVSGTAEDLSDLSDLFESEGFSACGAATASAAEEVARDRDIDLVVLDGRLGDGGAMAVCRRLASVQSAPIIMVSQHADVIERVIALEVGADDLIGRPFNKRELLARANALVRRSRIAARWDRSRGPSAPATLHLATRVLVGPNGARVLLPPGLFGLLQVFLSRPGELVSAELAAEIMQEASVSIPHFRTSIVRLRSKLIEAGYDKDSITTIRSGGYVMQPEFQVEIARAAQLGRGGPEGRRETVGSSGMTRERHQH